MQLVVLRITDEDKNDTVTTGELRNLDYMAGVWASDAKLPKPEDVEELCNTVFNNFKRDELLREFELKDGAREDLKLIEDTLQVESVKYTAHFQRT